MSKMFGLLLWVKMRTCFGILRKLDDDRQGSVIRVLQLLLFLSTKDHSNISDIPMSVWRILSKPQQSVDIIMGMEVFLIIMEENCVSDSHETHTLI